MFLSSLVWVWILAGLFFAFSHQTVAAPADNLSPGTSQEVALPDTPAGQCATAYFKAFNSGSDDEMQTFILKYRTEEYLKQFPMRKLLGSYRMINEACESLTPIRIALAEDSELIIVCRAARTESFIETRFQMDGEDPPHFTSSLSIAWPPTPRQGLAPSMSNSSKALSSL